MHIILNKRAKITLVLEALSPNPRLPLEAKGKPLRYYSCLLLQVCRVHF